MNVILKNRKSLVASTLVTGLVLLASLSISAQNKPKGKAWPAPATAVKMKNPVKCDDASMKLGKELYTKNCKSCHGTGGKGDGAKAEKIDISCGDFTTADFAKISAGELYWKTSEGRKPMPSFKEKMETDDIWAVVNYIKSFAK